MNISKKHIGESQEASLLRSSHSCAPAEWGRVICEEPGKGDLIKENIQDCSYSSAFVLKLGILFKCLVCE